MKRLGIRDLLTLGFLGVRSRIGRSVLTALGITVGIAALVAVMGISASSRADLLRTLDALGTNYLRVTPGQGVLGDDSTLPGESTSMIRRVAGVEAAAGVASIDGTVRRTDLVDESRTSGISIRVADTHLLSTLNGTVAAGSFMNEPQSTLPVVVLGSTAAQRLGLTANDVETGVQIWIADRWFTVLGILDPVPLAGDLDATAMIGWSYAMSTLEFDGSPSTVYVRTKPDLLDGVRALMSATANPENAEEVQVSRPSDVLEAKAAASASFTALLVGLGAVALLVGGIGIANVMIIAVLERRTEIGLRRAVGATRSNIAVQFLAEAVLQATAGGLAGTFLGAGLTAAYAESRGWPLALPVEVLVAGVVSAMAIGGIAGLYPAARAARLTPADALRPA